MIHLSVICELDMPDRKIQGEEVHAELQDDQNNNEDYGYHFCGELR